MPTHDAMTAVRELFHIGYWVARTYGQGHRPDPALNFSPALVVPPAVAAPALSPEELSALQDKLKAQDEQLKQLQTNKATVDAELQALRAQIAAAKQANLATPDTHDYKEEQTRDDLIDLLLREAGWALDAANIEVPVSGMPTPSGKGLVDYVLWGDDGKPLALIEAKRTRRAAQEGQQQAKLYADCLEAQYGQRPVMYYSNGYEHWMWDDAQYPPRQVQGFYKKSELALLMQRRSSRQPLAQARVDEAIAGRPYQVRAVRRISEAFERDHQRKALVVMATGAGKTRTVIALVDLLMRCRWAKRVLFLADRLALVKQAVNAFKKHLPDVPPVNLVTERHVEGRVYVSTYPTMMGLLEQAGLDDGAGDPHRFGVGYFDLVVIDEAHRSVYQKYRAIFSYFDALLVGLTATPTDQIDRNTYRLFDLENGVPTDVYPLDQAVREGHLVPFTPISVPLKFQREGIRYADLSPAEQEQWDELEWSEDGEAAEPPPAAVEASALNTWLFNADTVDKVLAHLMTRGHHVAGGDRLGKTIIFAANQNHANFIAERFDINYPQHQGEFARVITHQTEHAQSLIEDFSIKNKAPHMAISVDMLDTGIDVPEVLNLVLFKLVRSPTKFWQMLGRGTRLCPDLFSPGEHKKGFYVFDYCQNLEYFGQNPAQRDVRSPASLGSRLFSARVLLLAELDAKLSSSLSVAETGMSYLHPNNDQLRRETAELLCQRVQAMNVNNFVVRPQRRWVEKFAKPQAWKRLSLDDQAELINQLAELPSQQMDEDEEAKRFDLLLLRTQLSVLQASPDLTRLCELVREVAQALTRQASIPVIKAEMGLIETVAGEAWWEDVTPGMLETARKRLRGLIKLIEKTARKVIYTDFADELGDETIVQFPHMVSGLDMVTFKEKALQFLRTHEDHVALQRLKRGQPLTPTDLTELGHMLEQAGGTPELMNQVLAGSSLGVFIRSLVGMDRDAVYQAFSEFVSGTSATSHQLAFIELIVTELTTNGVVEAARLYESPYRDISPQGPEALFTAAKVERMFQILDEFKQRAVG